MRSVSDIDLGPNVDESMSSTNDSSVYAVPLGTLDVAETDASLPRRLGKEEKQANHLLMVRVTFEFSPVIILLHIQTRLPWKS